MTQLSRRRFFTCACCASVAGLTGMSMGSSPLLAAGGKHTDLLPDQALDLLKEGNRSFTTDAPFRRQATDRDRRIEIARGQTPFVVLVGCSDSRVPPELLFGRGLGELFIVRNAGNCPSSDNLRLGAAFTNRGSGSSGVEVRRPARGAASGDCRWSVV